MFRCAIRISFTAGMLKFAWRNIYLTSPSSSCLIHNELSWSGQVTTTPALKMSVHQKCPFSVYLRKVPIGGTITWWNWNPRLLLRESCGGALLFHNLHFRPHPYDRSNRIDTARRCHCCHILMLIQNFWEIASNHQCIILSPSFCSGDIHSGKYISLTPPFDSYHLIYEAPWSSQVILHPPLP